MSLPLVASTTVSPTVIFLLYADISVSPFKYRPTIPFPLSLPVVKFNTGELAVNLATSVVEVPSKYTPTP